MITHIKELRADKEPLLKVKSTIQEEILSANHLINVKSEEVTQLRQKVRYICQRLIGSRFKAKSLIDVCISL